MEVLLNHQKHETSLHKTVIVICDKPNAAGIEKAEKLGIKVKIIEVPEHSDSQRRRELHEEQIQSVLIQYTVEAVILSGYMRILTGSFVKKWLGRMINIHPIEDDDHLRRILAPWTHQLSTLGTDDETVHIPGIHRVCALGWMQAPTIPRKHDGRAMLADLIGGSGGP